MAKIIMVQGTSSGVGKSILSTALCRIFKEDGYKVAPFKAQNMSSNFHMLPNGAKMARSQAICAYACGIEPNCDMNPVLLIPEKGKVDVVLNGKLIGEMDSFKYKDIKKDIFKNVLESFERLSKEYDIIVIEGAGSPVELNLNKDDFVNMGLAKKIKAPVLLVSDITRGGIFASLYGTIELMEEEEQELIKGIIINKFIGEIKYFKDGTNIIEEKCGKNVLGIIPYMDINIEDEDNLVDSFKEMKTKEYLMKNMSDKQYLEYLDKQFTKTAKNFRENLNMKKIYEILENGV